jgi:hypothetical protein
MFRSVTLYQAVAARRNALTEEQVALLRWIDDGCPTDVMKDEFHRISAATLRNRELVKTSGRGADPERKEDGRRPRVHGGTRKPKPPIARQANGSVTEQLVRDVVAAGGSLCVPRRGWNRHDGVDYVPAAERSICQDSG